MTPRIKEIEVEVLPAVPPPQQEFVRLIAFLLDDLIPIPGTRHRVGLDPLIGLIPGVGDMSSAAFSSLILIQSLRCGVPRVVILRMAANLLLNALIGAIPGVGDVFSAWYKSNQRNYQLFAKHSGASRTSTASDWTFLIALLATLLTIVLCLTLALGYAAYRMFALLFGWT
jgi:hypothetical protein